MDSILLFTRTALGYDMDCDVYDAEIIADINIALMVLMQIGVLSQDKCSITGTNETWSDFVPEASLKAVQSYVFLKTKLLFDPPSSSAIVDAYNKQIVELEWRFSIHKETDWGDDN